MILFCITETATITYNLHLNELEMSILQIYRLLPQQPVPVKTLYVSFSSKGLKIQKKKKTGDYAWPIIIFLFCFKHHHQKRKVQWCRFLSVRVNMATLDQHVNFLNILHFPRSVSVCGVNCNLLIRRGLNLLGRSSESFRSEATDLQPVANQVLQRPSSLCIKHMLCHLWL